MTHDRRSSVYDAHVTSAALLRRGGLALGLAVLVGAPAAAAPAPRIVDKPIRFGEERRQLTLAYRRAHEDPEAASVTIAPRVIVVHHTGGRSARAAWRHLDRVRLHPGRRQLVGHGRVNVSAHFLVTRAGVIYRLMPEDWFARHCIGLNHISIGIENVGGVAGAPLTRAQLRANAALVRYLKGRHDITHVIGHHEYRAFEEHPYFREKNSSYRTRKRDPGPGFMRKLRKRIADLRLKGPPARPPR